MYIPTKEDLKKIQGRIVNYNDVHMSVCGSGCSCPCKQSSNIDSSLIIIAGMCGCNCTCGCNCSGLTMDLCLNQKHVF